MPQRTTDAGEHLLCISVVHNRPSFKLALRLLEARRQECTVRVGHGFLPAKQNSNVTVEVGEDSDDEDRE